MEHVETGDAKSRLRRAFALLMRAASRAEQASPSPRRGEGESSQVRDKC